MEKEENVLKPADSEKPRETEEDISMLKQLVDSLDESEKKLEEFYKKKDPENFNKVKKFMIKIMEKIAEDTK